MKIELVSTLPNTKEIQAFNFYNNSWLELIDSDPSGAVTSMGISKWKPGQDCSEGTDTVVLARATPLGPKAMYTFGTNDFWDFWGGCTVRFTWVGDKDTAFPAWAPLGSQTPDPTYPAVPRRIQSRRSPAHAGVGYPEDAGWSANGSRIRGWHQPGVLDNS
jgi:hypothetical protein